MVEKKLSSDYLLFLIAYRISLSNIVRGGGITHDHIKGASGRHRYPSG